MSAADAHRVNVWWLSPAELTPERCPNAGRALSVAEQREWRDGVPSLRGAARWLARQALSRELQVAPEEWVFDYLPRGRPVVTGPRGIPATWFSVSHTRGMVACAVASFERIGVDTERLCRRAAVLEEGILFTQCERQSLGTLDDDRRARRNVELWTLKEAYAKAVGLGLAAPFDKMEFYLEGDGATGRIDPCLPGSGSRWYFGCRTLETQHALAIAVEYQGETAPEVRLSPWFSTNREGSA
jgi:4'-phosphopantetheinyl transferase